MTHAQHTIVTGAGGYVGRHVVRALLDDGVAVTALVRPGSRTEVDERATRLELDVLGDPEGVARLGESGPTALVHLAWQDGFKHDAPSHMGLLSSHVRFLREVAQWLSLERLAVLGTMHEIGYHEGAIEADTPTNPTTQYGIAKDALRRWTLAELGGREDLSVQWLRCYYIHGDDGGGQSIFAKLLAAAERGQRTFPFTTGKPLYDFIPVDELGRQIAACVEQSEVDGVINCCTGRPESLASRVTGYIAEHDLDIELEYGAFPDRPYDSPGVWGDATRIERIMAAHAAR
ncbi:NAD(P)-dependent oxidoreductase [Agrococcus versicolor]|uniref:NAD(P)-dependent oxidoreductase n=1 Tax=Agrococcus versicolor TaxID=501482 RepID=A0ABN3AKP4_9MICO